MKKQQIIIAVVAGLVGFAAVFGFTSLRGHQQDIRSSSSTCQVSACVALKETGADPDTITVKKGDSIQFNSADGKTHKLTLGKGGEEHEHTNKKFQSGDFKADEGWRVRLSDEGSFFFHDHYNPKINILVVVYTPGKDYKVN